jgi:hypothetical protein
MCFETFLINDTSVKSLTSMREKVQDLIFENRTEFNSDLVRILKGELSEEDFK